MQVGCRSPGISVVARAVSPSAVHRGPTHKARAAPRRHDGDTRSLRTDRPLAEQERGSLQVGQRFPEGQVSRPTARHLSQRLGGRRGRLLHLPAARLRRPRQQGAALPGRLRAARRAPRQQDEGHRRHPLHRQPGGPLYNREPFRQPVAPAAKLGRQPDQVVEPPVLQGLPDQRPQVFGWLQLQGTGLQGDQPHFGWHPQIAAFGCGRLVPRASVTRGARTPCGGGGRARRWRRHRL